MTACADHLEARKLLLGVAIARFTAAARGAATTTPFALAWDGTPLLEASAGATTRIALVDGSGHVTLVLAGRCARLPDDAAARRRYRMLHGVAANAPVVGLAVTQATLHRHDGAALVLDPARLSHGCLFDEATETRMVTHMNEDHRDALRAYAQAAGMVVAADSAATLLGLDCHGLWMRLDATRLRIAFPAPCTTPRAVREALVAMARAARDGT